MKVDLFDFHLPEELIAQVPLQNRTDSRLMVLNKETGEIKHEVFKNVIEYLREGDCLVLNDTKVLPARLFGVKKRYGCKNRSLAVEAA
jgi:S-adenosylmethionine:tRNA ribosyltransferase-isomerase